MPPTKPAARNALQQQKRFDTFLDRYNRERPHQALDMQVLRKAVAGHVTGGRVFGYDNVRLNGHTVRQVNQKEAATVRRIFSLYAAGHGLGAIAHTLNAEGTPTPRPQQGRVAGWAPSSVREVLKRPTYRGEVVYGKTKKRDLTGQVQPSRRPPTQWVRVQAPELRVVPEDLAAAVDTRLASMSARATAL